LAILRQAADARAIGDGNGNGRDGSPPPRPFE